MSANTVSLFYIVAAIAGVYFGCWLGATFLKKRKNRR